MVLGDSIPAGQTAYVLWQKRDRTRYLINATEGKMYDVRDAQCPLKSIGCVICEDNVACFLVCVGTRECVFFLSFLMTGAGVGKHPRVRIALCCQLRLR